MQSFVEEISSWRQVFGMLDQLAASKENDTPHRDRIATTCPFFNKTKVRIELMEGINTFNEDVKN